MGGLSYQAPRGGWSKHLGFSQGPRKPGMQWTSQSEPGQSAHYLAIFDNRSTTAEMDFLANVWLATRRADCQAGFTKALDFILAAQYPNGGWPQVYPLEGGYHDDVTLNDDAMIHLLKFLMTLKNPSPEITAAIESGLKWFEQAKITGIGTRNVDGKSLYVADPASEGRLHFQVPGFRQGS